jgi:hypothetical protein
MLPTRGRGGGHDWIGVDALLWVDHVEIRLLLSRIKAVWAAMRQVRGVVVIVMVHEVKEVSKTVPCEEFIRRKKKGRRAGKKEKRGGRGRGRETDTGEEKRTVRFSTRLPKRACIYLFLFYFISHRPEGTIHPSSLCLASCSHRYRQVR